MHVASGGVPARGIATKRTSQKECYLNIARNESINVGTQIKYRVNYTDGLRKMIRHGRAIEVPLQALGRT